MLVLVALVALAIVSLVYASPFLQAAVSLIAMLAGLAAVIRGFIDRGLRQAFAIGFAVAMLGYLFVVLNGQKSVQGLSKNVEMDMDEGRLPTSLVLRYIYTGINTSGNYDFVTGELIPDSEMGNIKPTGPYGAMQTATGHAVRWEERPPSTNFMPTGHLWWSLLFGYIGGHFGRFVYIRRIREQPAQE